MKIGNATSGGSEETDVYKIINVATGKYLGASGTAQPVVLHDSGATDDRKWQFVKTTVDGQMYYNIDSKDSGILRATGSGFAAGAYLVVSTTKAQPAGDTDKIWTIHRNVTDGTFRLESKSNGRYLYHETDGKVYTINAEESDGRSKWRLEGNGTLSIKNKAVLTASISVYPNPAKDNFTISFNNLNGVKNIEIYNVLGKRIYQKLTEKNSLDVNLTEFNKGVYLIRTFSENKKIYHSKLIVK
jgi:hypothetical protein